MILYFKKYKDTNEGINWGFDDKCLPVDDRFANLEIELPKRKIDEIDVYGQGAIIIPSFFFSNRKISFSYRFKKNNNTIFTIEKDTFLTEWIYTQDETYLVRNTERGLQKIKGVFKLGGKEKYRSFSISDDIDIEFITEDAFFENDVKTVIQADFVNGICNLNFTNNGMFTSFKMEILNTHETKSIFLQHKENNFNLININLQPDEKLIIDFEQFIFYRGGASFIPNFSGTTFFLNSGKGTFSVNTNNSEESGICKLFFTERFI